MRTKPGWILTLRFAVCLFAALIGRPLMAVTTRTLQNASEQKPTAQGGQQDYCSKTSEKASKMGDKTCAADPKRVDKPAPLFGGSLTIKKSRQTTDNTALGFNGVDPNGKVQQAFLNGSATSDGTQKAKAMEKYIPNSAQVVAFQKEGGLPQTAPSPTPEK